MNIIARKPRHIDIEKQVVTSEFVVVDRGEAGHGHRYVSATATAESLASGEWFWGHYFRTSEQALAHFNGRRAL